jgi:phosphate-selective porin
MWTMCVPTSLAIKTAVKSTPVIASSMARDRAEAFTVGLNWYANDYFRVIFDYERTEFDDEIEVDDEMIDNEDAFLVQCQLEF